MAPRATLSILRILILSLSLSLSAQIPDGTLSGRVVGAGLQPAVNVCVSATPVAGGPPLTTKTGQDGRFTVEKLHAGRYRVEAGCAAAERKELQISIAPGEYKEIVISLTAARLEPNEAVAQGMKDAKSVSDLPSNGRDLTQVATLQAGVSSVKTQPDASNLDSGREQRGFGAQVSISGSRPQQNNYILNGISINDYGNSAPGGVLGLDLGADAVEKFTVSTSNHPAAFGRSSG